MPKSQRPTEERKPKRLPGTVVSLNERKQTLVKETIWEAAIDLFAEKGFDETTVDDIAAAAGTSRRSFFRYFESKNDLMAQPVVIYGVSLTDAIRGCPLTYSPWEVLRETLLTVAKASASNPRSKKIMAIAARYPAARQAQIARIAEVQDQVADAFSERFKRNSKNRTTARVLAALTHSLLSVTFQSWFEGGQGDIAVTLEHVLAELRDVASSTNGSVITRRIS